jgi:hypothetical protein
MLARPHNDRIPPVSPKKQQKPLIPTRRSSNPKHKGEVQGSLFVSVNDRSVNDSNIQRKILLWAVAERDLRS